MMPFVRLFVLLLFACRNSADNQVMPAADSLNHTDTAYTVAHPSAQPLPEQINYVENSEINTAGTLPADLVTYAQTLIGIPYLYASANPQKGFDCSGFITYVFNHFGIAVPRSSVDFTNVPHQISLAQAAPGDLILFTGTDSTIRIVGHMGIITENNEGKIKFIHATSGKKYGVTITPLESYYMGRFVKVIRVFKQ